MHTPSRVSNTLLVLLAAGSTIASAAPLQVPGDFPTIQAAIEAASSGDEIVVAPGTYTGPFRITKQIVVRSSNGAESTVLRGAGADPVVLIESSDGPGGTLSGFTVTGGDGQNGGGLFLAGEVAVLDCIVAENNARNGGGAFVMGSPVLSGVRFVENSATSGGAVFAGPDSQALIDGCEFDRNTAQLGGGVFLSPPAAGETFAIIGNASFDDNAAEEGGAIMAVMASFEADSASFRRNSAWVDGGAVRLVSSPASSLSNSELRDNQADDRGGAASVGAGSSLTVESCEIQENDAWQGGGGLDAEQEGVLAVGNSSLWGNSPADIGGNWQDLGGNLFDRPPSCQADLAQPFGVLDMADLMAFVGRFSAQDASVDFVEPTGMFDLADIIFFVNQYLGGCNNPQ
jgi:hypothetical protein